MKKLILLMVLIAVAGLTVVISKKFMKTVESNQVASVIVGPSASSTSYKTSMEGASLHYGKVREAEDAVAKKDYERAVHLLEDSIPYAKFKFEKGAVYYEIAEIYQKQGDNVNEMKYRILIPEYTENEELKRESLNRAEELQKIINEQK